MIDKKRIKIIGFDLDECLYPSSPEINDRIRKDISKRILERKTCLKNMKEARKQFENLYNRIGSGRKVLVELGFGKEESGRIMDVAISQAEILDLLKPDIN